MMCCCAVTAVKCAQLPLLYAVCLAIICCVMLLSVYYCVLCSVMLLNMLQEMGLVAPIPEEQVVQASKLKLVLTEFHS